MVSVSVSLQLWKLVLGNLPRESNTQQMHTHYKQNNC